MLMAKVPLMGYQDGNHRPFHVDREVERETETDSPVHLDGCVGYLELGGDSRSDSDRRVQPCWLPQLALQGVR